MMEITLMGLVLSLLLFALPLGISKFMGLNVLRKIIISAIRMLSGIAVLAGILYLVEQSGSVLSCVLFSLLLVVLVSLSVVRRSRLGLRTYFLPVFAGVLSSTAIIGVYVLTVVLKVGFILDWCSFIPVVGILASGSVYSCAGALSVYNAGIRNNSRLYYYLLGNGATHAEALHYFMRRAMEKAMIPGILKMAVTAIAVAPLMMWSMVISGMSIFSAAAFQIIMSVAMFASSVLSVLVTLVVVRRYTIDKYSRLMPSGNVKEEHTEAEN